jgi:predicted aspartyl protease
MRFVLLALLAFGGIAALGGCEATNGTTASKDGLPCSLARLAVIPVRPVSAHIVVDALVDEKPTSLIFDTGAFKTILSPQAAARLALSHEVDKGIDGMRMDKVIGGIGGTRATELYRAHELKLGTLRGVDWRFLVADMGLSRMQPTPDGMLGADVMLPYDIDLDLPDSRVIFYAPRHDCTAPSAFLHGPLYQTKLEYDDPSPRLMVTIAGKRLLAAIDTGAPDSTLFLSGATKLGLNNTTTAKDTHLAAGGIGPSSVLAVRHVVEPMTIGDLEISNLPMLVVPENDAVHVDMLLGLDLLQRIHMWISHSSRTLIMQYPPTASPQLAENGRPPS